MTIGERVTVRDFRGVVTTIVNKGDAYMTDRRNDKYTKPFVALYAGESFAVVTDERGGSHWAALWEIGL